MARERQVTVTLSLKAWEAFQKRRAEVVRRLESQGLTTRSADSIAVSELIEEGVARVSGSGDALPDEDDVMIDPSKL